MFFVFFLCVSQMESRLCLPSLELRCVWTVSQRHFVVLALRVSLRASTLPVHACVTEQMQRNEVDVFVLPSNGEMDIVYEHIKLLRVV